ncbi:MAG TPA: Bug family tripartite tricarboxylate transporter substrate binding protein [Burkholderiaceae bacterium]|nr:Bug family tripartite tricarboxylate transporter substrate binding protein [Burkholderiaceae bacterium]
MLHRRHLISAAAGALVLPRWALAQDLEHTRVLCGFPAGGTTDAVSRRVAEKLRGSYAKVSLVENKPGAGGRIAVEELKRSAPDGSSLLLTPAGMITLYPHVYRSLSYGIDDVTPVSTACMVTFALGVGPLVPESVKNLHDFLAWARANPDKANYGSPGAGSPPHFVGALLSKDSGVAMNHVPYRGSAPGIQDLLGGQVAAFTSPLGDYLPHLKSGKLRVLATSAVQRTKFTPDVATYAEQGFKDLTITEWYGFFLPPKAAPDVVQRAAAAIRAAVTAPDVVQAFADLGMEAQANTPAEMSKAVRDENAAWAPVIKKVGFKPEA